MFKGKLIKTGRACISTVLTASLLLSLFPAGILLPKSSKTQPVVIADSEPEETTSQLIVLQRTMTDSSGNNYTFTATYDSDSGLPSDAELVVNEISSGADFDAYLTETQSTLDSDTISYAHFFDISIVKDGVELQPQDGAKVNMQIFLEDAQTEDLNVVHFTEAPGTGSAEVVENVTSSEGDTTIVEFDAEGFSVYGVVSTILTTTITASDGKTYKITVTYDSTTGIPEDAELSVSEVSEDEYLSYLAGATEAIGEDIHNVAFGKLFDIAIVKNGVEYQPADGSSIKVKVELLDAESVEDVKVVHFEGDSAQELPASTNGMTVSFETSGFSVFSFLDFSLVSRIVTATIGEAVKAATGAKSGTLYENDDIILSGSMPSNGIVEAERVDVSVNGQDALIAYDIKIYANSIMKALGINWQPSEGAISVQLKSDALTSEVVDVYHMTTTESQAELVTGGVGVVDNSVTFNADSFSVYVIIEHEGGEIVTPRVAFHYISPNYEEIDNEGIYSYTAPGYEFLNKHNEYQITQILRDGETLEQIVNPPNKKDNSGNEVSFFYGWYTVDAERDTDDTTAYNSSATESPYYTGNISYTWPDPKKVDDQTPISIVATDSNDSGAIDEGDTVTWTIGETSGTAVLDAEGTAHVYIAPVYEDYYFVNFHMGDKKADEGLKNNLLTRRLVVFGSNTSSIVRIGDVSSPSPDPAHQIFAGWETVDFTTDPSDPQTVLYYETLDQNSEERDILHDGTSETAGASGEGYKIKVTKTGSTLASLDLYPVFAEARWVYFNTGYAGNGAAYVGAQYRLTNDENKGTSFTSFPTTSRPGYNFGGWYLSQTDGNGTGIQVTDGTGAFVNSIKGQTFYGQYTMTTDPVTGDSVPTLTSLGTDPSYGEKLFEVTSDGRLYFYKALDKLTVYANWTPKTVDYTVVYWLENANDDDYTLMYYKGMQGVAGSQTAAAPTATNESIIIEGETHYPYTENKLRFMHLSTDQDKSVAGDQSGIQQRVIEGDGSTIVNVYYDRNVYRLRFDIGFSQTTGGTTNYYVSNLTNSYNNGNDRWENFLTYNTVNLGTSNPFSESEYTGTYRSGQYTIYYYDIVAKYGENILDQYPGSQTSKRSGNTTYSFVGWIPQADSFYWEKVMSSIKGFFETMSEDLILTGGTPRQYQNNGGRPNTSPDNYVAVTVDENNTVTGEHGVTQEFRCRYKSGSGYNYLYRIYLADPENRQYPSDPTFKIVVTAGAGSTPNLQTAPSYQGYSLVESRVLTSANDTNGVTPTSTTYSYSVNELTEANVGNGMIMVFRFMPNRHNFTFKYGSGADPSLMNTEFGATQEYNYGQSLANADIYSDEAVATTPDGYSFEGWYENLDGVGNAFDFNTTMPDGDIVLYAVYKPIKHRVIINPNGAQIDHIDHTGTSYTDGYDGKHFTTFAPFNRAATSERDADSGYNDSQSTYINADHGETVFEYTVNREYVPIGDAAATAYDGRLYYYLNFQNNSIDGYGLPRDLRNALYVDVTPSTPGGDIDETELRKLYDFYHTLATKEYEVDPTRYEDMTAQNLSYDAWKNLYVEKKGDGVSPQLYRKCNEKEHWVFLGWFKDGENVPYNFNDPVTEPFTLTAHWRLDGGYTVQYTPVYWLESEDGNRYLINGAMDAWIDPDPYAAEGAFSYTDGAPTTVYKQPTDLTRNGDEVEDNSINFLGWRVVSVSTTVVNGQTIVTYTPLQDDVLYDPGDDFIIDVQYADSNNIIHMQAVYEETASSVRRPEISNLTLDANGGTLVDAGGNEISADRNLSWDAVGTILMDESEDQIIFGDIQSNEAIHLYRYATNDADTGLSGGVNYFKHPEGYLLLGFDLQDDPENIVWIDPHDDSITGAAQPYVPNYPADSVISVQRTDDKTLYAIWEPMVYASFENKTGGTVKFTLSSTDGALEVINVKKGMYERKPLSTAGEITLEPGETITLAFPKGAEKTITVAGTNNLGPGKVLMWDTSIALENGRTYSTNPTVDPDPDNNTAVADNSYSHTTDTPHAHNLASGEKNNLQAFRFDEELIVNKNPLTITFTSRDNAYALILEDNWNGDGTGGGTQEIDYGLTDIQPDENGPKSQLLPGTNTRFGYSFLGWAYSETATMPDFPVTVGTIDDLNKDDGFFSEGTVPVDDVITRTLYGVWEPLKDAVYIYKDVPEPGNQNKPFDFTLNISGNYRAGITNNYQISSNTNLYTDRAVSKTFSIKHGEYLRVVTTDDYATMSGHTTAFIQAEVEVYYPVTENGSVTYVKDTDRSGIVRWERNVTPGNNNRFENLLITVTEAQVTYYTTSVTLDYEEYDDQLYFGDQSNQSFAASSVPQTVSTNKVAWKNVDAHGTVTFNNVIDTYDIAVSKTLIRNTSEEEDFHFTASYVLDKGTDYAKTVELFTDASSFIVTSGSTNAVALTDIPAGAELTITEKDNDDYDTTILREAVEEVGKETSFIVTKDTEVGYTNTLKSYPVKLVKVDQEGTAGVVAATFNLVNTTNDYSLGSNLQAYDNPGSTGVFYTSGGANEPLYAGQTYTLTETFTESGYLGLDGPVTIRVSGDEAAPFTISNPNVTAEWDSTNEVWIFKVKNKEVKDINIVKALNDPLLTQRTFKFAWSYEYDNDGNGVIDAGTEIFSGTFTLSPISGSTARNKLTVPVGAKNLVVEELHENSGTDQYKWVADAYDTTRQLNSGTVESNVYTCTIDEVEDTATITFTNTRKTVPVEVKKKVIGPGGTFEFEALLSYSTAVGNYTMNDNGTPADTSDDIKTGTDGKATFTLTPSRDGTDSIILNVPYGAYLTVTETSTGAFITAVQVGAGEKESGLTTGQLTITEEVTITFTNSEVLIAPTGYDETNAPYMWIFALSMAVVVGVDGERCYRKRKARKEEEEEE